MHSRWLTVAFLIGIVSSLLGCAASSEASKAAASPTAPGGYPDAVAEEAGYSERESAGDDSWDETGFDGGGAARARAQAPLQNQLGAPPPAPPPADSGNEPAPNEPQTPPSESEQRAPLLIYEATLTMGVFEAKKSIDAVEAIARQKGGYLLTRTDQLITVRVPAEKFAEALEEVAKTGDELHREVSARDVTDQYNDLSIRLKNAEAMRERLVALLAKAANVQDALAVEKQLERIALDIEQIKGKLKRLRELIAFSTITVRFEARPVDKVDSKVALPFPWLNDLGLVRLLDL